MKGFTTFRRYYLDQSLASTVFAGNVLDIGGKKKNKRGQFEPPEHHAISWKYLNIDPSTHPDFCCSAENIPASEEMFDIVLMTEVLEHLKHPHKVLEECHRVLVKGGKIIISIPFLYGIHGDPDDYQRWTSAGIQRELEKAGFIILEIHAMGSLFGVLYDLIRNSFGLASKNKSNIINRIIYSYCLPVLSTLFLSLDQKYEYKSKWITTGYYVVGRKA